VTTVPFEPLQESKREEFSLKGVAKKTVLNNEVEGSEQREMLPVGAS